MQPGTRLASRYTVDEHVADRDDGSIWHGRDTARSQPVRIRTLSAELSGDPEMRDHFRRSIRKLTRLSIPGVLRVHECVEHRDGDTYVMCQVSERVEGDWLREVLGGGRQEPADVLPLMADAALAVEAAHQAGARHLALTPDSFIVGADNTVTVVDFGFLPPSAIATSPAGVYTAPEIARGETGDFTADVYSLGAIVFECLTGAPPCEGETASTVASGGVPPEALGEGVAPAVTKCVTKALSPNARDRFVSAAALAAECEQIDFTSDVLGALLDRSTGASLTTPIREHPPISSAKTKPRQGKPAQQQAPAKSGRRRAWVLAGVAAVILAGGLVTLQVTGGGLSGSTTAPSPPVGTDAPDTSVNDEPSDADSGSGSGAGKGGGSEGGTNPSEERPASQKPQPGPKRTPGGGSGGDDSSDGGGGDGGSGGGGSSPDESDDSDEPERAKIPDVIGDQEAVATKDLEKSGFEVKVVQSGEGKHRCAVHKQSPAGGDIAREGSTVDIHVKLAKDSKDCRQN